MRKWLIEPSEELSAAARRSYWEGAHVTDNYDSVWSMTEDAAVRARLVDELSSAGPLRRILVPGCGSRTLLERDLADAFPGADVYCTDYPAVIAAASRFKHPRVHYVGRDSADLGWNEEIDAVVVVNSILSESDAENRAILESCSRSLRPGGLLVGFFPTVFAALEIATLEGSEERMDQVNLERSTFFEQQQQLEQIFYTPLRLRVALREAGFELERMEVYFCDSDYFLRHGREYYGLDDDDLVIYEHLVLARKP